ncbi:hypothetical protein [Endozoicomonas sp. OPT23]|uniref:hypothetical protein n=1 Tax=Endozoicomonas sp. OPT23 TaxID=2072845 RepID=UPI00129A695B|nr:hypothetical protein [Endozoicomonas sp. OPT23]
MLVAIKMVSRLLLTFPLLILVTDVFSANYTCPKSDAVHYNEKEDRWEAVLTEGMPKSWGKMISKNSAVGVLDTKSEAVTKPEVKFIAASISRISFKYTDYFIVKCDYHKTYDSWEADKFISLFPEKVSLRKDFEKTNNNKPSWNDLADQALVDEGGRWHEFLHFEDEGVNENELYNLQKKVVTMPIQAKNPVGQKNWQYGGSEQGGCYQSLCFGISVGSVAGDVERCPMYSPDISFRISPLEPGVRLCELDAIKSSLSVSTDSELEGEQVNPYGGAYFAAESLEGNYRHGGFNASLESSLTGIKVHLDHCYKNLYTSGDYAVFDIETTFINGEEGYPLGDSRVEIGCFGY